MPGRGPDAWRIRPGSYFLLPFRQAFGADFPSGGFTVFLSIRAAEDSEVSFFFVSNLLYVGKGSEVVHFCFPLRGRQPVVYVQDLPSFPSFLQTSGLVLLSLTTIGLLFSY